MEVIEVYREPFERYVALVNINSKKCVYHAYVPILFGEMKHTVQMMGIARESLGNIVPKVIDFGLTGDGREFITTEYIEGRPCKDFEGIKTQLAEILNKMREVTGDKIYGYNINFFARAIKETKTPYSVGPWENAAEYLHACFTFFHLAYPHNARPVEFIKEYKSNEKLVLTHGDLHNGNILVDSGNNIVGIIDWELAGFYPESYEAIEFKDEIELVDNIDQVIWQSKRAFFFAMRRDWKKYREIVDFIGDEIQNPK